MALTEHVTTPKFYIHPLCLRQGASGTLRELRGLCFLEPVAVS